MNHQTEIPKSFNDNHWRENYSSYPYIEKGACYEDYQAAYQTGHEGYDRYQGKSFDEAEAELKEDYKVLAHKSERGLSWEKAKDAARTAWDQAGTT